MPPGTSPPSFFLSSFSLISKVNSQNFSSLICPSITFLAFYTFYLMFIEYFWVAGGMNIWLCHSNVDPSGGYVLGERIKVWQGKCILKSPVHSPGHPFHDVCNCCCPVEILADFHLFCTHFLFLFAFKSFAQITAKCKTQQFVTNCIILKCIGNYR